ncbi:MAG: DUF3567 domain-containing protein [Thiomonas sp.]|jgi:hypothetical protein
MQTMIYDSDAFCVLQLDWSDTASSPSGSGDFARGGYEIVDKFARKEIFLGGHAAEGFRNSVQQLIAQEPSSEEIDDFLDRYSALSRQSLHAH